MAKKSDKWDAKFYKEHSQGQFRSGLELGSMYGWKGDERVLDVGCGDGRITAEIAKMVPRGHVSGIDVSANMIAEAKKSFASTANLDFHVANIEEFNTGNEYDVVISTAAFHWVNQQQKALCNIYRAIKSGGSLLLRMSGTHKSKVSELFESDKWKPLLPADDVFHSLTKLQLTKMLESCGFTTIDVKLIIHSRTYTSRDEFFNWAFAWIPHATRLSHEKAIEFTNDLVNSVYEGLPGPEYTIESALLMAKAKK